jgi:hypothetical protein
MKLDLKIRTKLMIAFGGILALTGLFAGVAAWEMRELNTLQQQTQGKTAMLARADDAMWELRFQLPQYLLYPDAANRQRINEAGPKQLATVDEQLKQFGAMAGLTAQELEGHKRMVDAYAVYQQKRPAWFELVDKGKLDEASVYRANQTNPAAAARHSASCWTPRRAPTSSGANSSKRPVTSCWPSPPPSCSLRREPRPTSCTAT